MSCSTLDQQSTRLSVSAGALPEGFCPDSMQDLFNAMAARLIVTPSANFAGITMGSIEPSGNVGLWLKDCSELFVFDDATARYVPVTKGGFNTQQYFIASGSFIVPPNIYVLNVSCWGAGGGGGEPAGSGVGNGGGGGGGFCQSVFNVIPGQTINYTVGAGGTAGVAGGNTTFLTLTASGGSGHPGGANSLGVAGGAAAGGTVNIVGEPSWPADNASGIGGHGGASPKGGGGGTYSVSAAGKLPGGGGAGNHSATAGSGAGGAIEIWY